MTSDLSVIILAGREERHIRRCLERLAPLAPRQVFVVESQRGDRTHEIAVEAGATAVWHDWPGNQARQFNWAVDNLPIEGAWVLRLDADEYLEAEAIAELKPLFESCGNAERAALDGAAGLTLVLKRRFCGGEIRHGTNGIRQVRLFRRGAARYDETAMDERLIVAGAVRDFDGAFYDDSLMTMDEWRAKHRDYAKREAAQALASMKSGAWTDPRKATYYRLPRYLRVFAYFVLRYFVRLGFLDGYAGWMWHFWQGLWYRVLVDREIARMKKNGEVR